MHLLNLIPSQVLGPQGYTETPCSFYGCFILLLISYRFAGGQILAFQLLCYFLDLVSGDVVMSNAPLTPTRSRSQPYNPTAHRESLVGDVLFTGFWTRGHRQHNLDLISLFFFLLYYY